MNQNVIDLIIFFIKKMQVGVHLKDISREKISGYNESEISAAYSWLLQKYEKGRFQPDLISSRTLPAPRILHPAEKSRISKEAYGYMVELYYLNVITASQMERMIEHLLFEHDEVVDPSDIKNRLADLLFKEEYPATENRTQNLKGTESIN
ncbi:DUF494 family protein [Balneolaceae bacterium ANBcel3]|nr:DUF494 family protein [Balneolaceae bacterium ANBcel3]